MNNRKALLNKPALTGERSLKTLVENRTVYSLDNCELNLFETYQESILVPLKFNDLVVTSMLRGKKVMHLFDDPEFEYLPGETVIVPGNVEMKIDFPEASTNNPTQCLALAIDHGKIHETLNFLNERYPKEEANGWHLNHENYFFYNNTELAATLNKLIRECMSISVTKDALVDLALQELLVRIVQTQTVQRIDTGKAIDANSPIVAIAEYIRANITNPINLKDMSEKACMSISVTKDALVDLALQELLVRIVQTQTVQRIDTGKAIDANSPIVAIAEYIRANITNPINLKDMSEKACMSTTSFYRYFKRELGMSPIEFILNEKIKHAKSLLKNPGIQVNEVCFMAGFDDCNYFIRIFKKYEGITPKQYQLLNVG